MNHYDINPAQETERGFRWDSPLYQIHWLLSSQPEEPLPVDEFLEIWGDEPGMVEFVNDEPPIGATQEFDVGCNSNLTVKRVA
jgi:hypothetical protein